MRRAYVYRDKSEKDGKLMALDDCTETFKKKLINLFDLSDENIKLFSANDCEIQDIRILRDDEKIYISTNNGSAFDVFGKNKKSIPQDPTANTVASDWITLNVGGKHFTTTRSTLTTKEPLSMLARMFAGDNDMYLMNPSMTDDQGAYLIDRSPEYFDPILNYLRHGDVIIDKHINPKGVLEEAKFYGIDSMIPLLNQFIEKLESNVTSQVLTRMDVVRSLITTTSGSDLRFQGVNLSGADLNRLDLRNINFKYACLSHCNLSGANLSHCCLERADLSHANLEGAQLSGVKALCANMEGSNLKGCSIEGAIMEGVNLKGANMEGSHMAGVNLRVATLKNANLQDCDLRIALLAGADLECCNLSGSDLHEANLRGANLKDAAFEIMLTPLHMAQVIR